MNAPAAPRTLLIEEGWHATLAIARALADHGHTVTVLTANDSAARYRRGAVRWISGPAIERPQFPAHVAGLMRATPFDHVLPLTEAAMARLWDAPGPWHDRLHPATTPWQRQLLRSKHALVEHMAARGIEVPAQHRLDAALDLDATVRALGLPLVLKGATGSAGKMVRIVDSRAALDQAVRRARAIGGDWALQAFIPGPTYLVGGLFVDGEAVRLYGARKLAQHPPRTGGAIHLRSTDDAALLDLGRRALRELRWTGFASADLMRDADGRHVLLEINPRLWGSFAGAAAAGVELFAPFAALLAGHAPAPALGFTADDDCLIFPRYLNAAAYRTLAGARQALRDLRGDQGRDWRDPGLVLHTLRRLFHMRRRSHRL
ncbi:MAG: ATP-grasp domain-containing protein [Deltaproteobacteria bacterium]|nr:ATP-grasp domain-containing protein [Deltaproteobacteria bacterium]